MATIMATVREGTPLTDAQETQWRTWNVSCRSAYWQDLLRNPSKGLSVQDYARAAIEGFRRGVDNPQTVCTTRYASHQGRGAYYTSCNTY